MLAQEIPEGVLVATFALVGGGLISFSAWLVSMVLKISTSLERIQARQDEHDQDRAEAVARRERNEARLSALEAASQRTQPKARSGSR